MSTSSNVNLATFANLLFLVLLAFVGAAAARCGWAAGDYWLHPTVVRDDPSDGGVVDDEDWGLE